MPAAPQEQPAVRPNWNRAPALATGTLCTLLGACVLAGWYTHTEVLVHFRPDMEPMWPNGGLCLLLWGAALLLAAAGYRKTSAAGIVFTLAVAALSAIEYLLGVDLHIDRALVRPFLTMGWHPGRMAPNAVLLFLMAGATLPFHPARPRRPVWVGIIGSVVLANGVIGVGGYLIGVPTYGWWEVTRMPLYAAVGFTILGAGFVAMAWCAEESRESGAPRWLPAITGVACLMATLYLWQGLQATEDLHVRRAHEIATELGPAGEARLGDLLAETETPLPEFALALGIVLSTLLVAAIYFAQVSRRRERAAENSRRELEQAIAGRHRAEKELGLSEEQRSLAMEAAGMGACSWDDARAELSWDARGKGLLGFAAEDAVSYAAFLDAVHPEDRQRVREAVEAASPGAGGFAIDYRVVWPGGEVHWLATRGRSRQQGVTVDATPRKLAEQALRRSRDELEGLVQERTHEIHALNRDLEQHNQELAAVNHELEAFTYSVSHDLRAPLRHIDGFSKILADQTAGQLNDSARRALERIRYGAHQMGRMIDDLLQFSRMGRRELVKHTIDLHPIIEEAIEFLKSALEGREIDLRIGELPALECDPGLMKHVIMNLLSNAIKFTRERNPAVIEIGSLPGDGTPVVYVRDNGVGFDMRYADKLFGIFQRFHRREEYDGIGVGLATVQRIVHKHGGRVWAESEAGKGTTFYFTVG
ncbi:MAG: PAS domain-containing protein [Acidobacteriia bacterium]|nr:PAS domain-containing protein [Terriglobia bacterium]